jgi:peptide/nickel transport system permease protein
MRIGKGFTRALYWAKQSPTTAFGLFLLSVIVFSAAFGPVVIDVDPTEIDLGNRLLGPSEGHFFGTDALGRDVFTRIIYGARTSILVGIATVGLSLLIGVPIGLVSGYFGGRVDTVLMRFSDVFLAFPPLLLPLLMVAMLGAGLTNAMIAISVSWFPWYARILRASVLSVREELYVKAATAYGASSIRIMGSHIFPNALTALLVQATLDFGYVILWAAALSFIGLGAVPPSIEWGLMLASSQELFLDFWWLAVFPGFAIFVTVLSVNLVGDGIRDFLDPETRRLVQ